MRALGLRPLFPVLHRRGVLPARLPARALRPEPLARAARRKLELLLAESLRIAHAAGALRTGTWPRHGGHTVQPKAITFDRRQTAARGDQGAHRLAKRTACGCGNPICVLQARRHDGGTLCPAKQFKRHRRELRILRSRLGRIIATSAVRSPARPNRGGVRVAACTR